MTNRPAELRNHLYECVRDWNDSFFLFAIERGATPDVDPPSKYLDMPKGVCSGVRDLIKLPSVVASVLSKQKRTSRMSVVYAEAQRMLDERKTVGLA